MSNLVESFKGKAIEEANYKNYDISYNFAHTIDEIKRYSGISGIDYVLNKEYEKYKDYQKEYSEIVKVAQNKNSEQYNEWKENYQKKNICKLICVLSLIVSFIGSFFYAAFVLLGLISIAAGIVTIVYKLITMNKEGKYNNYTEDIYQKLNNINTKYISYNQSLYNEADNIYLNSLDPTHRETVLMRRDQERQHQERMEMERKILNSQKASEAEGEKLREAQEQLLNIEKERERRYWNNRY